MPIYSVRLRCTRLFTKATDDDDEDKKEYYVDGDNEKDTEYASLYFLAEWEVGNGEHMVVTGRWNIIIYGQRKGSPGVYILGDNSISHLFQGELL